jgi:hypothetical protein
MGWLQAIMAALKKEVGVIRASTGLIAMGFTLVLAACASTPAEEESERLDTSTGTTLTLMPRPVELVTDRTRGSKTDPFAYLAPFETNRMGAHELFLWVSAPQVTEPLGVPQVFCGEELIGLEPIDADLQALGLSGPPYKLPAPWSAQWYFKLSGEVLDCFAGTQRLRIITQAGEEEPERFIAEAQALTGLADFAMRVRTE